MGRALLAAFAAASILSAVLSRAGAMTPAAPSALGVTAPGAALFQQATVVCGNNGCVPVQTKRVQRHQIHH